MTSFFRCLSGFGRVALALAVAATSANAQGLTGFSREAQTRLANQVSILESEKSSRTPAQQKLSSALALSLPSRQQLLRSLPRLRTGQEVKVDGQGLVRVQIEGSISQRLLAAIKAEGGIVEASWPASGVVYARLTPAGAEKLAALSEVTRISTPAPRKTRAVTSEGDRTHRADNARKNLGATGKGIKIGVLSDSVDFLEQSRSAGELGQVTILPNQQGTGSGEGTAMLEIIHDLAPDAELFFATAGNSKEQFAANIRGLRDVYDCDIIVDDIYFFDEAPFQDDVISQAVNHVVADGALYFSAMGNDGNKNDGTSGCWEGNFKPIAGDIKNGNPGVLHNWGDGFTNTAEKLGGFGYAYLFWSDPLGGSRNDYDLYVVNQFGEVVSSSTTTQNGTQNPIESTFVYEGEQVVVKLFSGQPRFLHFEVIGGQLAASTAGRGRGHSAIDSCISVGAAPATAALGGGAPGPFPNGFNGKSPLEWFSSDGPRRKFYRANGQAITPGNFLAGGGRKIPKPDITAADGVTTSVPGFRPFYGTSAAAPHAAAIAALVWSVDPSLSPDVVKKALYSSAIDIRYDGFDRDSGLGIVMAPSAVANAKLPGLSITDVTATEGGFAEFELKLTRPAGKDFSVSFQTVNGTAKGGTADSGADYRTKLGEVLIAKGQSSVTVRVPVFADAIQEPSETFELRVTAAPGLRLDDASGIATIVNAPSSGLKAVKGSVDNS